MVEQQPTTEHQPPIGITPAAADHIRAVAKAEGAEGQGLRVAVVPGGCSGYEYSLRLAAAPQDGDVVIEEHGVRVFVDAGSIEKLAGTVLDYVAAAYGGTLRFLNPRAVHTCGCGTSFSTE